MLSEINSPTMTPSKCFPVNQMLISFLAFYVCIKQDTLVKATTQPRLTELLLYWRDAGVLPKWTRGWSGLEEHRIREGNQGAALAMCSLHSQQYHSLQRVSVPGGRCLEAGNFRVGGQGTLNYYLCALWEKNVPQRKCVCPWRGGMDAGRQKSDKHFQALAGLVFASRAFFQGPPWRSSG